MNKTITLLALSSLAFASKADHQKPQILHFDKPLIAHDDEFRLYPYPEYSYLYRPSTYPPPFFSEDGVFFDDDDDELFSIEKVQETVQKAAKFVKENPEVVKQAERKIEELVKKYSGNQDLLKKDAKKAFKYVTEHPEVLKGAVQMVKGLNHDDELFNLDQLIRDGVELAEEVKNNKNVVKVLKDVKEVLKNPKKFLQDDGQTGDNRLSIWSHIKNEFEKLEEAI